jgi:hypothetical protein
LRRSSRSTCGRTIGRALGRRQLVPVMERKIAAGALPSAKRPPAPDTRRSAHRAG